MSFPARDQFDGDLRITPRLMRLYKFCRLEFDFWAPRSRKAEVIALGTGMKRTHVGDALDKLVAYGFLIEWPRGEKNSRWFTIVWDRNNIEGQRATSLVAASPLPVDPVPVHKKKIA